MRALFAFFKEELLLKYGKKYYWVQMNVVMRNATYGRPESDGQCAHALTATPHIIRLQNHRRPSMMLGKPLAAAEPGSCKKISRCGKM